MIPHQSKQKQKDYVCCLNIMNTFRHIQPVG